MFEHPFFWDDEGNSKRVVNVRLRADITLYNFIYGQNKIIKSRMHNDNIF